MGAKLLTCREAARHLGITTTRLKRLADADQVPHVRLPGDELRFCPEDLAAWIESCKSKPGASRSDVVTT
jgi:excisionase family DNA binding protein